MSRIRNISTIGSTLAVSVTMALLLTASPAVAQTADAPSSTVVENATPVAPMHHGSCTASTPYRIGSWVVSMVQAHCGGWTIQARLQWKLALGFTNATNWVSIPAGTGREVGKVCDSSREYRGQWRVTNIAVGNSAWRQISC